MTVDRTDNNLSRFRYSAPAWHESFNRGRRTERERAIGEKADWREGDFQRARVAILEGVET